MSQRTKREAALRELQAIPSIGKACAIDLYALGIRKIGDLHSANPAQLYKRLNSLTGQTHDVCMLYTFRCAVYYASEKRHDPEKLQWWYWKQHTYNEE